MSGVKTGTRLDQLRALRARLDHEITIETAREANNQAGRHQRPATPTPNLTQRLLTEHGITTRQVKEWAVHTGLLDEVRRGRVALDLVRAYITAHQNGTTPTWPPCGTEAGYQWHRWHEPHNWPLPADDPCGCRAAHRAQERATRNRLRAVGDLLPHSGGNCQRDRHEDCMFPVDCPCSCHDRGAHT